MKKVIKTAIAAFLVTAFASVSMASGSMVDCNSMTGGSLTSGKGKLTYQTLSTNNTDSIQTKSVRTAH